MRSVPRLYHPPPYKYNRSGRKWQTRPLVREGAPYGQNCNFQWKINIWSWAPDGARHQDRQTDWLSVAKWLWLWLTGQDEKGSLKSETVKYGHESQVTPTRERLRWQGPAASTKDRTVLSTERAPHKNKSVTVKTVINIWSWAPDGAQHQDLLTDWLTDRQSQCDFHFWYSSTGQPLPFYQRRNNERTKKKNKSPDIEQIYGHGSQRGSMPGVTMLSVCRQ
jgi:hypothetical protein